MVAKGLVKYHYFTKLYCLILDFSEYKLVVHDN